MTVVAVLRSLWRSPARVAGAAACGILVGVLIAVDVSFPPALSSREYHVGVARTTALVDTPRSHVINIGDTAGEIGAARASLLAVLLTSAPIKQQIARRAGLRPDEVIVIPPGDAPGDATPSPAGAEAAAAASKRTAYTVRASVPSLTAGEVPIIVVETQAAEAAAAASLAEAAVAVLKRRLEHIGRETGVPDSRRLLIRELGPTESGVERRGPHRFVAILAGVLVFLIGCGWIVAFVRIATGWRVASALEDLDLTADARRSRARGR